MSSFEQVNEMLLQIVTSIAPQQPSEQSNEEGTNETSATESSTIAQNLFLGEQAGEQAEEQANEQNEEDFAEQMAAKDAALADAQTRIFQALQVLVMHGNMDGENEKRWAIVEAIKKLIANEEHYDALVTAMRGELVVNEDGEFEHEREWDEGIEPDAEENGDYDDDEENN